MAEYIPYGRYVCDTHKTWFRASIVPIIWRPEDGGDIMTPGEAIAFVDFCNKHFDPHWRGAQGITTNNFLAGMLQFARFRIKHKGCHIRLLRQYEELPEGYIEEKDDPKLLETMPTFGKKKL